MARKTDGEIVDDLQQLTATLSSRLDNHENQMKTLQEALTKCVDTLSGSQTKVAVLDKVVFPLWLRGHAGAARTLPITGKVRH